MMTRVNWKPVGILAVMAIFLGACGSDSNNVAKETPETTEPEQTVEQAEPPVPPVTPDADVVTPPNDNAAAEEPPAQQADADPCSLSIQAGDSIQYSKREMSAPSSCSEITVTITHTGSLPAAAMGHNWVLMPKDALEAVGMAGMSAGPGADYVPDDDRVVAATKIVGGGESASVSFRRDALDPNVEYVYACTFPGHWSVMKGSFTITG